MARYGWDTVAYYYNNTYTERSRLGESNLSNPMCNVFPTEVCRNHSCGKCHFLPAVPTLSPPSACISFSLTAKLSQTPLLAGVVQYS